MLRRHVTGERFKFHVPGEAVLSHGIGPSLGPVLFVLHASYEGEEDGRGAPPVFGVAAPHVLGAGVFSFQGFQLRPAAVHGDGYDFVF